MVVKHLSFTLATVSLEEATAVMCRRWKRHAGMVSSTGMNDKRKVLNQYLHVVYHPPRISLFRPDLLQLSGNVCEVVGVGLGDELADIGLLDEVLVALLVSKVDGILLGLELQTLAVHEVTGRGPTHEGVLPAVALGENVPVHEPVLRCPVSGLCGGLCGLVDAAMEVSMYDELAASERGLSYRTWRAWRSTGAPDRTAAATLSPGSLPSMTRLGMGEKLLQASLAGP
jgi:hypothetical protein